MTTANDIWLIAGLGNPEAKYDGTRHNAGFAALDALAAKWGISVNKSKFQGLWGQGEVEGHKVVLLKPLTYMNLSSSSCATTSPRPPASSASGPPARQAGTTASRASLPGWAGKTSPASVLAWVPSPTRITTLPPGYWASSRLRMSKR